MEERIVSLINNNHEYRKCKWLSSYTTQLIDLICEEIEKVKNPYPKDTGVEEYRFGFWLAIQRVLSLLKE